MKNRKKHNVQYLQSSLYTNYHVTPLENTKIFDSNIMYMIKIIRFHIITTQLFTSQDYGHRRQKMTAATKNCILVHISALKYL